MGFYNVWSFMTSFFHFSKMFSRFVLTGPCISTSFVDTVT